MPDIVAAYGERRGGDVPRTLRAPGDAPPGDAARVLADRAHAACLAPGLPGRPGQVEVWRQLGAYRASHGLRPLRYSKALELAADEHARDMWERNFFSHTNPDGKGPGDRAVAAGFCHGYGGENIYMGTGRLGTAAEAMRGWRESPGHDANMRRAVFRWGGIGHFQAGDRHYWVQLFAYE